MVKGDKFTNVSASVKELRATVNDLRNTYKSVIHNSYYADLIKNRTDISKEFNVIESNLTEMKDSIFSYFAGASLFVASFLIFFVGTLLIFNYIDKTNKNHIVETPETIEVNIVNPGNKQINVNLPGQNNTK